MDKEITYWLVGIAVVAGVAFWVFNNESGQEGLPAGNDGVVCTQEALMCPDGSYVGRTGDNCEFVACPSLGEFITGKLERTGDSFRMLLAALDNGGEVVYVLPLTGVKVTNALAELDGRIVRTYGYFTAGNEFETERLETLPGDLGDPTLGKAKVGGTVFVNGVKITLEEILEDSRCPAGAICVQAGRIRARVTACSNTDKGILEVSSDKKTAFDAFQIIIAAATPYPYASQPEQSGTEDYEVTFRVSENE